MGLGGWPSKYINNMYIICIYNIYTYISMFLYIVCKVISQYWYTGPPLNRSGKALRVGHRLRFYGLPLLFLPCELPGSLPHGLDA